MKKLLVSAGALVALAVTATPAYAVPATSDATATVKILRAVTLASEGNLDLQTVVLSGAAPFSAVVGVAQDGTPDCDGGSGNVTCSGTMTAAAYRVKGADDHTVTISVDSTLSLANQTTTTAPPLTLTVDAPASLDLGADGADTGAVFNIGGSISVTNSTADGVYLGTFAVSADYQ